MTLAGRKGSAGLPVYDAARALAAFAVLFSHARGFVVLDASEQPALSIAGRLFFGLTGLGHQAVTVFFVVSGALVTKSLLALSRRGRLTVGTFAVSRLTRLWVVLLPCLVLGGLIDRLGQAWAGGSTRYGMLPGVSAAAPMHLDGVTLLGNALFLQGIAVPTFGSNAPLWSLAIEAWYYVCAFLILRIWQARRRPVEVAGTALALGFTLWIAGTPTFWALAPTWALGAALGVRLAGAKPTSALPSWAGAGAIVVLLLAVILAKLGAVRHPLTGTYAVAVATTLVLLAFGHRGSGKREAALFHGGAAVSYSLYVSHFPILALVAACGLHGRRLPLGPEASAWMAAMLLTAALAATAIWWLFERRTDRVRAWFAGRLDSRGPAPLACAWNAASASSRRDPRSPGFEGPDTGSRSADAPSRAFGSARTEGRGGLAAAARREEVAP